MPTGANISTPFVDAGDVDPERRVRVRDLGAGLDDLDAGDQPLAVQTAEPVGGASGSAQEGHEEDLPHLARRGPARFSPRRIFRLAMAAATGRGEAECVEVIDPGGIEPHDVLAADHRRDRQGRGDALAAGDQVGLDAVVLVAEHLAGPAEAGLDLVEDGDDVVRRGRTPPVAARTRPAGNPARRPGSSRS